MKNLFIALIVFLTIYTPIIAGEVSYEKAAEFWGSYPVLDAIQIVRREFNTTHLKGFCRGGKIDSKKYSKAEIEKYKEGLFTFIYLLNKPDKENFEVRRLRYNFRYNVEIENELYKSKGVSYLDIENYWQETMDLEKVAEIIKADFNNPIIRCLILDYQKGQMPWFYYEIAEDDPIKGLYLLFKGKIDATTGKVLTKNGD